MTPEAALAIVPALGGADATITAIAGGLTNRTFRVDSEIGIFFLRLDDEHTGIFNLDRQTELFVLETASAQGLAPEIVYSDLQQGILLSRLIEGETWCVRDLAAPANIKALGELLQRVHALPPSGVSFDAQAISRHYADNLLSRSSLLTFAGKCVEIIAAIPPAGALTCCHNDVVLENLIGMENPVLIDWEYACDNDPLFDLASLIGYHDLPETLATELLKAYAGEPADRFRERLDTQLRLYDAMQWLWLANRQVISPDENQAARLEQLRQRIR